MTDDELVQRTGHPSFEQGLRGFAAMMRSGAYVSEDAEMVAAKFSEAAARIEALTAERDAARTLADQWCDEYTKARDELATLRAELAAERKWRDIATYDPLVHEDRALIAGTLPNGVQWREEAYYNRDHWVGHRMHDNLPTHWRPLPVPPDAAP